MTEKVRTGSLWNSETEEGWVNLILVNNHTTNNWTINIVKVHCICINYLWRSWFWSFLSLFRTRSSFSLLFPFLTPWPWPFYFLLGFVIPLPVFWITASTSAYFTASWRKFSFPYIFWNLAYTGFVGFWKSLHAIFAAPISGFEALIYLFFLNLLFLVIRMILWVLSPENKILFGTSCTSTCLATLTSKVSPSLVPRYYTDTCFFIFVSVCMLTFFTTIFITNDLIIPPYLLYLLLDWTLNLLSLV